MDIDPEVLDTTNILLDAVTRVLRNGDAPSESMASSAILIYKTVRPDGTEASDYVITTDLDMYDVVGLCTVVADSARAWFQRQDEIRWDDDGG